MSDFQLIHINDTEIERLSSDLFGWGAGVLSFCILIPQIVHVWRTKSSKDLSIWFLILNEICVILYIIYGLFIGSYPIVICDSIIFILNTMLIISKKILDTQNKMEVENNKFSMSFEDIIIISCF